MKKLLILVVLFLAGCASAPPPATIQTKEIVKFEYKEIQPVALPDIVEAAGEYTDEYGKTWALFDPKDLYKIEQAYISAERNSELVQQQNLIARLLVERANLIRELAILEEYRALKMEVVLDGERADRRQEQIRNSIESISLKILAALAIAVAL